MGRPKVASVSGMGAAMLGSLCCGGPVAAAALGVGAGLGGVLEPMRSVFGVIMVVAFVAAFRSVYGRARKTPVTATGTHARADDVADTECTSCELSHSRAKDQVILWITITAALVLWFYPTWSKVLL